jgi:hypothetical protein
LRTGIDPVDPRRRSCDLCAGRKTLRLKTLTYTSRARLDLSDGDLSDIHQAARHLNALDGITGLLLFDGARFLQIIEGAEGAIDNLVERLRRDPRHSAFEIRDERFVEQRAFPDWSMELLQVSAGYKAARDEVASILPAGVSSAVRDLVLRMSGEMASA